MQWKQRKTKTHFGLYHDRAKLFSEKFLRLRPKRPPNATLQSNPRCSYHRVHTQHQNPTTNNDHPTMRKRKHHFKRHSPTTNSQNNVSTSIPAHHYIHKPQARAYELGRAPRRNQSSSTRYQTRKISSKVITQQCNTRYRCKEKNRTTNNATNAAIRHRTKYSIHQNSQTNTASKAIHRSCNQKLSRDILVDGSINTKYNRTPINQQKMEKTGFKGYEGIGWTKLLQGIIAALEIT